jgi:CIC family chloride channel protein
VGGVDNARVRLYDTHLFAYLRRRPPGEKRFLLLVPLTGLATGLAAAGLIHLHAMLQQGFWGSGQDLVEHARGLSALHRFLAPTLGGAIVGLMILINRGVVRGHGTAGIIEAVARGKGFLGIRAGLTEIGAILVTVASGGSLGREGSLLRAGSTLGSFLGRRLGVPVRQLKILVACGAAAGMAAAYNAPIGGAMFALEVILGSFALESFGPIVVASAIGTLVSRLMISPYLAYAPPPYAPLVSLWELLHFLLLGVGIGLASALLVLALNGVAEAFKRSGMPIWMRPAIGFAAVGFIGIAYPEVFGNGYDTVDRILRGGTPIALILLLPLVKVVATAATRGSGGAGGIFTPTLFMGAALGSVYGSWCKQAFPGVTSQPGAYALAGMGAMLAGTTQAPFTAIFMIFELTGEYASILPLMVACTAAMTVCRLLRFESIYTQPLLDRGVVVGGRMEELVMDRIEVRDVMRPSAAPVHEDDTLDKVVDRMKEAGRKELFVVDDHGALTGAITLGDLSDHLARPETLVRVRVGDVAYANPPVLNLDDRMTDAIGRWSQVSRDRLPVVENAKTLRLVGELSAGDIFTLYSQEILHKEARLASFVRTGSEDRPETMSIELPPDYSVALVTLPESFEGATLRELSPRARFGVNIIEINRTLAGGHERRIIPDPDTLLKAGDGLIVVGRPVDIAHLGDPLRLTKIVPPDA